MKKKHHLLAPLFGALLLTLLLLSLASCANFGPPWDRMDGEGYTVSVRFDANGGLFAGTEKVTVVDVFNPLDNDTVTLLAPDDPRRGDGNAFEVSRTGYFFAGWYRERHEAEGADGSVSYSYGGKWDFENDTLSVSGEGATSEVPVLTLYAAWIPYPTFEIYAKDPSGNWVRTETVTDLSLTVPAWDEKTGKLNMGSFPKRTGYTLWSVYTDPECTQVAEGTYRGTFDEETATPTVSVIPLYTEWREGDWYRIYDADQWLSLAGASRSYFVMEDIDFEGALWPPTFTKANFSGTVEGNGHVFRNVSLTLGDNSQTNNGLFGTLTEKARIRDLSLENITVTVAAGSRKAGATFGLLSGGAAEGCVLDGVTLSGRLILGKNMILGQDLRMGLVSAMGNLGLDASLITVESEEGGPSFAVNEDGTVSLTR